MRNGSIRDCGDRALLLECDTVDEVLAVSEAIRAAALAGVSEIVPGARTVLVGLADSRYTDGVRDALSALSVPVQESATRTATADMVIDVSYDGPDLDEVATLIGMTVDEVIAAHTSRPWRVAFGGFAPGFAYLTGGDPRLTVPRRREPRTRVPAGAVALAGEFSGVYPRQSPGGWQLIGSTRAAMWDTDRPRPALLTPGMWVRFRGIGGGS